MVNNSTILGKFYLQGTNNIQQTMGDPSQQSMVTTIRNMLTPGQGSNIWNEFADYLINRIGLTYVHQNRFSNPLREFLREPLTMGDSVEEVVVDWAKSHSFSIDAEDVFRHIEDRGEAYIHKINYQEQWRTEINRLMLKRAFVNETGLNSFVQAKMDALTNPDELKMYQSMLQLFKLADVESANGLYREHLDAAPTDETTARAMLKKIQELAVELTVPTTIYSAVSAMPVVVNEDELVLFVRGDVNASLNVDGFAPLFNMDKADIPYRVKVVPKSQWPLNESDYAVLTSRDFFQVYPVDYSIDSIFNPASQSMQYFLLDTAIVSCSPIVPCIVLSSEEGTQVPTVKLEATAINCAPASDTVEPGGTVQLTTTLNGTITPANAHGPVEVKPDGCVFTLTAQKSAEATEPVALNARTYVDRHGVLHVQKSKLANGNVININCVSVYYPPEGKPTALTTTAKVTVKA